MSVFSKLCFISHCGCPHRPGGGSVQFCWCVWDAACEILAFPLLLLAVLFGKYVRTERYVTWRTVGPLA